MEGEGQYVGDEAAEWFSKYMNKPGFKMYKLSRPRVIREHDEWSDIGEAGDKVTYFKQHTYGGLGNRMAISSRKPSHGDTFSPCIFPFLPINLFLVP